MDTAIKSFMQYIHAAHAIESEGLIAELDAQDRFLLEMLVKKWVQNDPMTVVKAMGLKSIGSPATLHRKLAKLRKLGFVQAQADAHDQRIKWLIPTSVALDYFSAMAAAMKSAMAA